jgi:two-component system response regulator FixJ
MPDLGLVDATQPSPRSFAGAIQTTIVTLDRSWGVELAQELRSNNVPTLLPESPARWLQGFGGDQLNCIIFDLDHGGAGALDAIAGLTSSSVMSVVVAAASAPTLTTVVGAIRAGAYDFVNKRFHFSDIAHQIFEAGHYLLGKNTASVTDDAHRARIASLSRREREILVEIAGGLSTKQIAAKLGVAPRTVQMFRDRIKRRLEAKSIEEALGLWIRFGGGSGHPGSTLSPDASPKPCPLRHPALRRAHSGDRSTIEKSRHAP